MTAKAAIDSGLPELGMQFGGRLRHFVGEWGLVTSDAWILETLAQGYSLEFAGAVPKQEELKQVMNAFSQPLWEEVQTLRDKGAIEEVPRSQRGQGCYTHVFIRLKKNRKRRLILNLKPLNLFLEKKHFKMDHLNLVLRDLGPDLWAVSLDLTDAYLHVPLRPNHRKFLRLAIGEHHFQFVSLCFGLASAPRVFTKIMVEIGALMRSRGVRMFQYLDDWLIVNRDKAALLRQRDELLQLTQRLGL